MTNATDLMLWTCQL